MPKRRLYTKTNDGFYFEAASGAEKGIYRKHEEWDVTLYYVINDYNTLERTGFFIITIPEKNLVDLLETVQDGLCFGLECSDGRLLMSADSKNETLIKSIEEQISCEVSSGRGGAAGNRSSAVLELYRN